MALNNILLDPQVVKNAFDAYGIKTLQLQKSSSGYRNHSYPAKTADGKMVNLILYKSEPKILQRIKTANTVSDFLYDHGLPARSMLDARILKICSPNTERYAALYRYLPGKTIPWDSYTRVHLKKLGEAMATMHRTLNELPSIEAPDIAEEYIRIFQRMYEYFTEPDVTGAMNQKLKLRLSKNVISFYLSILRVCKQLPKKQILHMDFVRGNVLFDQNNGGTFISGILDFEKAGYGTCHLDIARTLAFLLIDCKYKAKNEIHNRFLISGYVCSNQVNFTNIKIQSSSRDIYLLEELTKMFVLHDFYKFLRHNPYEFLSENEHFLRTKQYLLEYKLLTPV
jgi:Ser/Thr protein kinase RdoA (MazF antagonist)